MRETYKWRPRAGMETSSQSDNIPVRRWEGGGPWEELSRIQSTMKRYPDTSIPTRGVIHKEYNQSMGWWLQVWLHASKRTRPTKM